MRTRAIVAPLALAAMACVPEPTPPTTAPSTPDVVSKPAGTAETPASLAATEAPDTDDAPAPTVPIVSKRAMLVLDASGSMWGKVEGRHKIQIAREVIDKTVKDWDPGVELGLMAYGHNRKGDCADIELLMSPGPLDAAAFSAKAKGLNPTGMTPMTAAVQRAAELLKSSEEKATVILVTDGKETCDLDPCAVGRALEAAGVDFTAHVISFDVPEEDAAGMRCLADTTGGVYLAASDEAELAKALKDTQSLVTDHATLDLAPATLRVPAEVPAGSVFAAEWTGPKNAGDMLRIQGPVGSEITREVLHLAVSGFATPVDLRAPDVPETYAVHYVTTSGEVLAKAQVRVTGVGATVDAPETVLAGAPFDVTWTGPMNRYDGISLYNDKGERLRGGAFADAKDKMPASLFAPDTPGTYEVRFQTHRNVLLAKDSVQVLPAPATVRVDQAEIIAGNKIDVHWTGPGNDKDSVRVYTLEGARYKVKGYLPYQHQGFAKGDGSGVSSLTVPEVPGDYLIVYVTAADKVVLASTPIHVQPAAGWVQPLVPVEAGERFVVQWGGPENLDDRLAITTIDGAKRFHGTHASSNGKKPAQLIAPDEPGQYVIRLMAGNKSTIALVPLVVR